ncbi:MAG: cation diffusion facilitator family transporter [Candidatus Faecisoma sp.]|nr:cation diffusion facilitator family transporter [Acholeplasma sp.]MDY2893223.1 cation diffusion facilitator family transporter [Candidatus Faecisoma sp.]
MSAVTKTMVVSMIVNVFLSLIKIISGILGSCNSLIADGIHSISDLSTDIIAIIGNKLSLKPADNKHPYGHGKIEYLTSLIISIVILFLGFSIIYNTINRQTVIPKVWVLIVSFITIISKYFLSSFIIKQGKRINSTILIASGYESRSDAVGSIGVFLSVIVMHLSSYINIFKYADKVATIIIAILIIKTGFNILKENIGLLLGEQLIDEDYLQKIKNIIYEEEDLKIKNIHILRNGPYNHLVATITMNNFMSLEEAHDKIDLIELKVKEYDEKIKYVTIHVEPTIDK